jgi:membrane peptidoglycan carboxypeptidase
MRRKISISQFQGTVTVRKALQLSLNLPALAVPIRSDQAGSRRGSSKLGAALVLPDGEAPGLAIGLGGVGIKLSDLVMLYAGIARLGTVLPLREHLPAPVGEGNSLMTPVAAWYVSNVLLGTPPPENGVGGRIAFKTGTSYGYRDAWSIGFDGKHALGIWVGRPDGAPVPGLVGRSAAAPILFDAFARLPTPPAPLPRAPEGVLTTTSAKLPPPLKHFQSGDRVGEAAPDRLHILFPPDGARLELRANEAFVGSDPLEGHRRRGPAHGAGQRHAGLATAARYLFLSAKRTGLRARHRHRQHGRDRQRSGAAGGRRVDDCSHAGGAFGLLRCALRASLKNPSSPLKAFSLWSAPICAPGVA